MWSDIESKQDFLNYSEASEIVVNVLSNPAMLPISIGVFGSWGTGKSTILNLIEQKLQTEKEEDYILIKFDAWLYQGFDDARAALIEVVTLEIAKVVKDNKTLLDKTKSITKRVNKLRLLAIAAESASWIAGVPTFGAAYKAVEAIGDGIKGKADSEDGEAISKIIKDGQSGLKELLNEEITSAPKEIAALKAEFAELLVGFDKKIVIFVDNLDRCLPKQTIQTLESLRLFLFMPNTAFVIAADEDMVRHAVKEHFNGIDEKHITDYLDKLIQFPVKVPKISTREVRAYLFLLYASIHETYGNQKLKIESLRAGLENNLRLSWKEDPISVENALLLLDSDGPCTVNLLSDFTVADRIAPLLASAKSVEGNPRIVKRMLNVISMRNMIASARRMPVDLKLIAKMALFERCCNSSAISVLYNEINATADGKPDLFRQLEAVKNDLEAFEAKLPEDWKEHKTFLFDWISLEPSISDRNLRPLVYLSKETVPLRIVSRGLSEIADKSYRLLIRTSKVSSPSAVKAIGIIPEGEEKDVMRLILEELRQHSNWSEIPSGFAGAFLLAQELEKTRAQFKAFISEVMPKPKPWFKSLIKEEVWFNS
ncbi:NTPase KAP [Acinetobacter oleivorans]|uniref:KAP family P-loop NTPase fold protein n=1 Tax=Acinetobacter oleivorans TaxID=1148157 RepID=UPI00178CA73A|nr:P-loop NTPase fold protein [Acinetobacter oleivorans]MBE2172901.1 NTPase KAP [Acinetobacter oleivorans]